MAPSPYLPHTVIDRMVFPISFVSHWYIPEQSSRRRILQWGAAVMTVSFAGCSQEVLDRIDAVAEDLPDVDLGGDDESNGTSSEPMTPTATLTTTGTAATQTATPKPGDKATETRCRRRRCR